MWTPTTRRQHSRGALRYESDLSDKEWLLIEPWMPPESNCGRPRDWSLREIVNAIFYVMRTGCPWRLLPDSFPPWQTVYRWFAAWRDDDLFDRINHDLVMADRERAGRDASPTAAIIDSQSVKTTESGGPRGYDAGKKIKGRKRHALVDTDGRALVLMVHEAEHPGPRRGSAASPDIAPLVPLRRTRLRRFRATQATRWPPRPASQSRSSRRNLIRSASPSSHAAGSSSDSSLGSTAIVVWPRTSRPPSHPLAPSSMPPPSCCSCADWLAQHDFRNGLLGIERLRASHQARRE